MVNSLADESALLAELRELADQGRYHQVLDRLRGLPVAALEGRTAFASYQLSLAAYQQAGLVRGMAETHHNIGISWRERGDYPRALEAAEQAVRLATVARDDSLLGLAFTGRAEIHLLMGDEDLAR